MATTMKMEAVLAMNLTGLKKKGKTTVNHSGGNCIKIGLPGKLIRQEYVQENRTSKRHFLLLRISFPGRPIFTQFIPGSHQKMGKKESLTMWMAITMLSTTERNISSWLKFEVESCN